MTQNMDQISFNALKEGKVSCDIVVMISNAIISPSWDLALRPDPTLCVHVSEVKLTLFATCQVANITKAKVAFLLFGDHSGTVVIKLAFSFLFC